MDFDNRRNYRHENRNYENENRKHRNDVTSREISKIDIVELISCIEIQGN